jgi:hypothetical protein
VHDILEQARTQLPIAPRALRPELPGDLEQICLKCLEKQPADRYPSAGALADALAQAPVVQEPPPFSRAPSAPHPNPAPHGQRAAVIVAGLTVGCVFLAVVSLALLLTSLSGQSAPTRTEKPRPTRPEPVVALTSAKRNQSARQELKGIVIGKPFNNLHQFFAPYAGQETNFAFSPGARAFDRNGEELDPPHIKRVNKAGNVVDVLVESDRFTKLMTIKEIRLVQGELLPADRLPQPTWLIPGFNGEIDYLNAVVLRWSKAEQTLVVHHAGAEVTIGLDPRTQSDDGTGQQFFREPMYRVLKEGNVVNIRTRPRNNKPTASVIVLTKGKLLSPEEVAKRR